MGDGAAARAVSGPWPAGAGVAHGLSDGGFSVSTEPTTPKPLAICYSPSRKTRCSGTTTPEMPATCCGQSGHLSVVQEVGTTVRHGLQGVKYRGAKGLRGVSAGGRVESTTSRTNLQDGRTRLIIQLTNEITRPPSSADQKPSTWNGTSSRSAIHEVRSSMSALTTNVNRPSVMT